MAFRTQLFGISNQLTNADVQNLKFLCTDLLPRREVEKICTAFELFGAIEGIGELAPDKLNFLEELLKTLNKGHLIIKLKEALAHPSSRTEDTPPQSAPSSHSDVALSMRFKQFLITIGNDLPASDLRNVSYFFQSYDVKGLTAQALQKLREPAELFDILRNERIISPTNLSKLRFVLDAIGRKDICEKVDEYMKSVCGNTASGTGKREGGREGEERRGTLFSVWCRIYLMSYFCPLGDFQGQLSHPVVATAQPNSLPQYPVMERNRREDNSLSGESLAYSYSEDPMNYGQDVLHAPPSELGPRTNIRDVGSRPVTMSRAGRRGVEEEGGQEGGRGEFVGVGMTARPLGREESSGWDGVDGSGTRRTRTRTQMLQQQVNDKTAQIRELENQLALHNGEAHERAHDSAMARQEHERAHNEAVVMELEKKNKEVEELRSETAKLRQQLVSGEDTEIYPMNMYPPHGKAIVIVNDKFEPNPEDENLELRERAGAEEDMRLFREMFEFLGYSVECHSNLTAEEMHQVIDKVACENHEPNDSCVCCVSTHGDENVMYGSDSVGVKRSEFLKPLKQTESLCGKPKMFFFQACRTKVDTTGQLGPRYPIYYPDAADRDADIFIANASTAHNASYRSHINGSWFVMALHHVFTRHSHHLTLDDMMHKVNNLVCDARGTMQEGGQQSAAAPQEVRQCAESTSSFRMGLRFKFPQPTTQ